MPIFNEHGKVSYFAAIDRDITENKKLQLELCDLANTDPLTGILNRRRFYESAADVLKRMRRYHTHFGLMIIDIDDFKNINDQDGHLAGDIEIKNIANVCKNSLRKTDQICRYGGDEFLIL